MQTIKWEEFLTVDGGWIANHLCSYAPSESHKLCIRAYSLRFSGTQQRLDEFAEFISDQIDKFCFPPDEIDKIKARGKHPWKEARRFFGHTDPQSDGKVGEVLLFLFVEAILKSPLMAHKIVFLTNPNDQVKGGDGIFVGEYQGHTAICLGEAKVVGSLDAALAQAFGSLNRFHDTSTTLSYELEIAPRMRRTDLSQDELDFIYKTLLDNSTPEHKACIKVHPVLIVYDESAIDQICVSACTPDEAQAEMDTFCVAKTESLRKTIEKKLQKYQQIAQVHLDFFFLPLSDVAKLRALFYEQIHGMPFDKSYRKKTPNSGKRRSP